MTPVALFAKLTLILIGAASFMLAFGMWISIRQYPEPEPPADRVERIALAWLAVVGAAFIGMGWAI